MKVSHFTILLNSHQPDVLRDFYRDVVGLETDEQVGGFKVGGAHMLIDGHSDVSAGNQQPARVLINLFVDDIAAEQARLENQGVKFIRSLGREFWGGVISTFLDPDGNYAQLIEFKPEP